MLQMFHDHIRVYMCAHAYGSHRSRSIVFVNFSPPEINTLCCLRISFMFIMHFEQTYPILSPPIPPLFLHPLSLPIHVFTFKELLSPLTLFFESGTLTNPGAYQ